MAADSSIRVEVIYATPQDLWQRELNLPTGSSAEQAIAASGLLAQHPAIDLGKQKIGIYGQPCTSQQPLVDGDRVEIYHPLLIDPMQARRNKARQ